MLDLLQPSPTREQLQSAHLWDRLVYMRKVVAPYQSQYRVVYEDPHDPEAPARVLVPDPHWMAYALHGNVLPAIEAYHKFPLIHRYERNGILTEVKCDGINSGTVKMRMESDGWTKLGEKYNKPLAEARGLTLHSAPVLPVMTEKQAILYLVMKDTPPEVWKDFVLEIPSNRRKLIICKKDQVPSDRKYRNAWEIIQ
jgi:hypothetical protein